MFKIIILIAMVFGSIFFYDAKPAYSAPVKLPVHFAFVELADRQMLNFDAACAAVTGYVEQSRAYFQSQGAGFTPEIQCIHSVHTYAEVGSPDVCGEGMRGSVVRNLIIMGELGWNLPVHSKTNERAVVMVTGGGGFAGNIDIFSGTQNSGLALLGDWGLIYDITGQRSLCDPGWYTSSGTVCHELLHAFTVDSDAVPAQFCDGPLDAVRIKQLKSSTNRMWLQ